MGNLRTQTSDRSPSNLADNRTWTYTDPVRPHVLNAFAQQTQPAQTVTSNAYGEPAVIATAGQGQDTLLWNAQGMSAFYNPRRRHSSLGYLSPIQFEIEYTRRAASA